MKDLLRLALCTFVLALGIAAAADPDPAETAARTWLKAADAGDSAKTYELAAPIFKSHVTAEDWQRMLKTARGPLGGLKERTLSSIKHRTNLPGGPDGDYAILQFDSTFERKASASETVTAMKQSDGSWQVAGYYIN